VWVSVSFVRGGRYMLMLEVGDIVVRMCIMHDYVVFAEAVSDVEVIGRFGHDVDDGNGDDMRRDRWVDEIQHSLEQLHEG